MIDAARPERSGESLRDANVGTDRPGLRLRRIFAESPDGILVLDAGTGSIVDANPRLLAMLDVELPELIGRALWELGAIEEILRAEFVFDADVTSVQEQIWCHVRQRSAPGAHDEDDHTLTTQLLRRVFALQSRERLLFDLANHDALTGLFNRRFLDDILERELGLSQRHESPLSVALLDLDDFKHFNDSFGHAAGDLVLWECARVLDAHLRKGDIACRIGGDEFALVMPDASTGVIRPRLEELCALLRATPLRLEGRFLGTMTASVGIAGAPEHADHARGLLRCADSALYDAKHAGRDQVVVYGTPAHR